MNKLTKIGLTALCGSLSSVAAANAGALDITGAMNIGATYGQGPNDHNGNPLGFNKAIGLAGSGELDNGYTWAYSAAYTDDANGTAVLSSATITFTMDAMGTVAIGQGAGSRVGAWDDVMPTAWEESWFGIGGGPDRTGASAGTSLRWQSAADMLPYGITLYAYYNPEVGAANSGSSASAASATTSTGSATEFAVQMAPIDGLDIGVARAVIQNKGEGSTTTWSNDIEQMVGYVKYTMGSVTLGYGQTYENPGFRVAGTVEAYENTMWGVSFAVNDNLTVSYGEMESEKDMSQSASVNVTMETEGLGISYNLGGATVKLHTGEIKNANYNSASGNTDEVTAIELSLAF